MIIVLRRRIMAMICIAGLSPFSAMAEMLKNVDMSLGLGYRVDNLDWSIAGNLLGTSPNILSELSWRSLDSVYLSADAKLEPREDIIIHGSAGYGEIQRGNNQDSDYSGDNRTFEFSRSNNRGGGKVSDASISLGSVRHSYDPRANRGAGAYSTFIPKLGYSYHNQNLNITDGVQTIDYFVPVNSPFTGLDSIYQAEWWGPWAGIDFVSDQNANIAITLGLEYHLADYYAKGNWNLRNDLAHPVSYEHDARGDGWVLNLAIDQYLTDRWVLTYHFNYQAWSTDPGLDTIYVVNQTTGATSITATRLNAVEWQSLSASLQATYHF